MNGCGVHIEGEKVVIRSMMGEVFIEDKDVESVANKLLDIAARIKKEGGLKCQRGNKE
jgi:hypothetical protein